MGGVGGWEMGWWWLLRIQSQCLEALEQAPLKVAQEAFRQVSFGRSMATINTDSSSDFRSVDPHTHTQQGLSGLHSTLKSRSQRDCSIEITSGSIDHSHIAHS